MRDGSDPMSEHAHVSKKMRRNPVAAMANVHVLIADITSSLFGPNITQAQVASSQGHPPGNIGWSSASASSHNCLSTRGRVRRD